MVKKWCESIGPASETLMIGALYLIFSGYHFPSPANIGVERISFLSFAGRANRLARFLAKNLSWKRLGGLLGALGGQDRESLRGIRFFGPSWGRLGRLLARLGGLYWPS